MTRIKELADLIIKYRDAYYNDSPLVSDNEYDNIEMELKLLDPNNEVFKSVGYKGSFGQDYIHEIPMLSANKVQGDDPDDIQKWIDTTCRYLGGVNPSDIDIVIEPKLDGVSIEVVYINGSLNHAVTRGNGKIGELIDHSKLNLPKRLKKKGNYRIRGEAVIFKADRSKLPDDAVLRNTCAGLLRKKELTSIEKSLIKFVPFQIIPIGLYNNEDEMLTVIESLGLNYHIKYTKDKLDRIEYYYKEYMDTWRERFPYETDGLMVIIDDNNLKRILNDSRVVEAYNHFNVAVKPTGESSWTELIGITWQVGRTGKITPVGIIKPTNIGGVIYNRVTLNNASFVLDNLISIGSKINVKRSNDVIPKVIKVIRNESKSVSIPTKCPVCLQPVEFNPVLDKELYCYNDECGGQLLGQFLHWFACNDIVNIAGASLNKFLKETKFTAIWQLYKPSEEDFKKMFENTLGISMDTPSMQEFLRLFNESRKITEIEALGYYGIPKIGLKTLEKYNIYTFDDLIKYKDLNSFDNSKLTLLALHEWLNNEQNFNDLKYLIYTLRPTMNQPKKKRDSFEYCISGELSEGRKEIIRKIEVIKPNWSFVNTVTKDCKLLINAGPKTSSKHKAAIKYNVPIVYFDSEIDWEYLSKL